MEVFQQREDSGGVRCGRPSCQGEARLDASLARKRRVPAGQERGTISLLPECDVIRLPGLRLLAADGNNDIVGKRRLHQ